MSTDQPDQPEHDPLRKPGPYGGRRDGPSGEPAATGPPGRPGPGDPGRDGGSEPGPGQGDHGPGDPGGHPGPYGSPPPPGAPPSYPGGPFGGGPSDSGPPPQGPPPDGPPPGGGPYPGGGPTPEDPLAGMPPLASRGRRLLARIIDALLIGIPVTLIVALSQGQVDTADDGRTFVEQIVYTVVYLVYEGAMLTRSGQTVGKRLMRIRVAMLADGAVPRGGPGWLRAAVYQVPLIVPCLGFVFWLVNVLSCTWDRPYRQCLHDKAARTVVVSAD